MFFSEFSWLNINNNINGVHVHEIQTALMQPNTIFFSAFKTKTFLCLNRYSIIIDLDTNLLFLSKNDIFYYFPGFWLRVRNRKFIFLFLNQNICWGYSMRWFFWAPKTYFKPDG